VKRPFFFSYPDPDQHLLFGHEDGLVVQDGIFQAGGAHKHEEYFGGFGLLELHARHCPRRFGAFDVLDPNFDTATGPEERQDFSDRYLPDIDVERRGVL
jgi:hypothetical protein